MHLFHNQMKKKVISNSGYIRENDEREREGGGKERIRTRRIKKEQEQEE